MTPTPAPSLISQDLKDVVSLVRDILTCCAALFAAGIAFLGLRTWRAQLKGKTEFELAQRLLQSVYKVRQAIAVVRHPWMSVAEESDAVKEYLKESEISESEF